MQESVAPFLKPTSLLGDLNCENREHSFWSTGVDLAPLHINFSQVTHSLGSNRAVYVERVRRRGGACSQSDFADSHPTSYLTGRHFMLAYLDSLVCTVRNEDFCSLSQLISKACFTNITICMLPVKIGNRNTFFYHACPSPSYT